MKQETNLCDRDLVGKRYRRHPFALFAALCLLPMLFSLYSILFERLDWETVRVLLMLDLMSLIPAALFFVFDFLFARKPLCILSDGRVFFFGSRAFELDPVSQRKREWFGDGSILYTEIKHMNYIPAVRRGRRTVRSSAVVLLGADFQVTVENANRRLIRMLKMRGCVTAVRGEELAQLPDFDAICYERRGLWRRVWADFEENGAEKLMDDCTKLLLFELNEKTNEIELELMRNGNKFVFVLDSEDITMCETETDTDKNLPLSDFSTVKELYIGMRSFITQHS